LAAKGSSLLKNGVKSCAQSLAYLHTPSGKMYAQWVKLVEPIACDILAR